jgi:hypothetical protein
MLHSKLARAAILVLGFAFSIAIGAAEPSAPAAVCDLTWLDERVQECQPRADERKFDQIGWLTDIASAEKLAKEHKRPIFLFTHDGQMATGRC